MDKLFTPSKKINRKPNHIITIKISEWIRRSFPLSPEEQSQISFGKISNFLVFFR